MSKLATVRLALTSNTSIRVVAVDEQNHFPYRAGFWTHMVDFVVAPNQGIYTAPELQTFMDNLVPGLEPTCVDQFHDWDTSMQFGKLYFDEDIGSEVIRREITMLETDFLPAGVVEDGKAVFEETKKIRRRTWVRLYPDQEIAMARGKHTYYIPRTDLLQFQRRGRKLGFIARIGQALAG